MLNQEKKRTKTLSIVLVFLIAIVAIFLIVFLGFFGLQNACHPAPEIGSLDYWFSDEGKEVRKTLGILDSFKVNIQLSTGYVLVWPMALYYETAYVSGTSDRIDDLKQFIEDRNNNVLIYLPTEETEKRIEQVNQYLTTQITLDDILNNQVYVYDIINSELDGSTIDRILG